MKLVAISDIHGDPRARPFLEEIIVSTSPDVLAICGDITTFGPASLAESILAGLRFRCVAVPGNCDPDEVISIIEKNCISLHGRRERIDGLDFAGIGGAPMCHCNTPQELEEERIFAMLAKVISDGCILVSHAPPMGINDLTKNGRHLGSSSILDLVKKHKPRLVLSGHVHEARGILTSEGTVFVNPGPLKEGHVAIIDVDASGVTAKIDDFSGKLKNL